VLPDAAGLRYWFRQKMMASEKPFLIACHHHSRQSVNPEISITS
jgi:hypothetical protein